MPLPVFANTILPSWFFPVKSDCPESVGFPFPGGACRIRLEVLFLCPAKEVSIGTWLWTDFVKFLTGSFCLLDDDGIIRDENQSKLVWI